MNLMNIQKRFLLTFKVKIDMVFIQQGAQIKI